MLYYKQNPHSGSQIVGCPREGIFTDSILQKQTGNGYYFSVVCGCSYLTWHRWMPHDFRLIRYGRITRLGHNTWPRLLNRKFRRRLIKRPMIRRQHLWWGTSGRNSHMRGNWRLFPAKMTRHCGGASGCGYRRRYSSRHGRLAWCRCVEWFELDHLRFQAFFNVTW